MPWLKNAPLRHHRHHHHLRIARSTFRFNISPSRPTKNPNVLTCFPTSTFYSSILFWGGR